MADTTRRTALSILGLSAAGSGVAAEDFLKAPQASGPGKTGINGLTLGRDATSETIARALRNLAAAVEAGEVNAMRINVSTALARDEIVTQCLRLEFVIPEPSV